MFSQVTEPADVSFVGSTLTRGMEPANYVSVPSESMNSERQASSIPTSWVTIRRAAASRSVKIAKRSLINVGHRVFASNLVRGKKRVLRYHLSVRVRGAEANHRIHFPMTELFTGFLSDGRAVDGVIVVQSRSPKSCITCGEHA